MTPLSVAGLDHLLPPPVPSFDGNVWRGGRYTRRAGGWYAYHIYIYMYIYILYNIYIYIYVLCNIYIMYNIYIYMFCIYDILRICIYDIYLYIHIRVTSILAVKWVATSSATRFTTDPCLMLACSSTSISFKPRLVHQTRCIAYASQIQQFHLPVI